MMRFLAVWIVEEIMVEFRDTKRNDHIISQSHQHGSGWGGYTNVGVDAIEVDWIFSLRKPILGQKWVGNNLSKVALKILCPSYFTINITFTIAVLDSPYTSPQSNVFEITCCASSSIMKRGPSHFEVHMNPLSKYCKCYQYLSNVVVLNSSYSNRLWNKKVRWKFLPCFDPSSHKPNNIPYEYTSMDK